MPAGLLGCVLIGLMQGSFQSVQLDLKTCSLSLGLAVLWIGLGLARPEAALLLYTVFAVNLNSIDLPVPHRWIAVSPPPASHAILLIVGTLLRLDLTTCRSVGVLPIMLPYLLFLAGASGDVALVSAHKVEFQLSGIFRFIGYYALNAVDCSTRSATRQQVRRMVVALIVSVVIPIGAGFFRPRNTGRGQVLWAGAGTLQIVSTALLADPSPSAYYLVMLIPLLLVFFLVERDQEDPRTPSDEDGQAALQETCDSDGVWQFSRFWLGVLSVAAIAALLMTFIRGVWFALVISLIVLGLACGSLRFRQLVFTIPAAIVVVFLVTFSVGA